ncbi:rCG31999 [Rattus norvegicus]|uniref:RCG31999 n=1 Tax=Rattus norvegicus TaxID=10116 RepID=A6KDR0_RAT|nr:rCG31999 [Rattus norvegicus]
MISWETPERHSIQEAAWGSISRVQSGKPLPSSFNSPKNVFLPSDLEDCLSLELMKALTCGVPLKSTFVPMRISLEDSKILSIHEISTLI